MTDQDFDGKVALVTGGSNGIGAGVAERLADLGARVVVADIDVDAGTATAERVGGSFIRCDVADLAQNEAAVAHAVDTYGGLDIAHLNAGVTIPCGVGDDFELDAYRTAMAINLDGVVFGVHAALPALKARGGGAIVATSSLAGLVSVPFEPIYAANKHAVVGLVRSLGPALAAENITVNALCPGFAETAITLRIRPLLAEAGIPLLNVSEVVETFERILRGGGTGECWFVQPGRTSEAFRFRNVPGPRTADGESHPMPS
jgi:NAD(P)-dependent dehydrogenase (short-subunit alcohol dehydrogenase family)